MWNSPRFCFNSYLELDRRGMRMRVRCAAWQLWVSEKFSSVSVVNTRPVCTHNTPKTQFTADITNTTGVHVSPFAPNSLRTTTPQRSETVYQRSAGTAVSPINVQERSVHPCANRLFSPWFKTPCDRLMASLYAHHSSTGDNQFVHAAAKCRIKYSAL